MKSPVRRRIGKVAQYALLVGVSIVFLLPLLFLIVGSLKQNDKVLTESDTWRGFLPASVSFENYRAVLSRDDLAFTSFLRNSIVVGLVVVVVGCFVNSLAGYGLARLDFAGRKGLLGIVIALNIVPFPAIAVPLASLLSTVPFFGTSFRDTLSGLTLPFLASPLFVYMFYNAFLAIPKELEEAAKVDGANTVTTFRRIVMPLMKPTLATAAILTFLSVWGELLWPVLMNTSQEKQTLPQGLSFFFTLPPLAWGEICAYAMLMTAPVLVMFLLFQKWFVQSVVGSGIKG